MEDINKVISEGILKICKTYNFKLLKLTDLENRSININVEMPMFTSPPQGFVEQLMELPFMSFVYYRNFRMGKVVDGWSRYDIKFGIKAELDNGNYNSDFIGKFLQYKKDKNINSLMDIVNLNKKTLSYMQYITRTTTDKKLKRKIWDSKYQFVKYLYSVGLATPICRQRTTTGDELVKFNIFNESHWLRKETLRFLHTFNELPVNPEIYDREIMTREANIDIITCEFPEMPIEELKFRMKIFEKMNDVGGTFLNLTQLK